MKITLECPKKAEDAKAKQQELRTLLNEMIAEQGLKDAITPVWKENGELEATSIPSLLLHSFLLKAEQLGLSYQIERKVIVNFV